MILVLLIVVSSSWIVYQILVTVHTTLLISRPWIERGTVRQHRSPFVGDIKQIPVTFHALVIFDGSPCFFAVLLMVIFVRHEMHDDILDAMSGLRVEKIVGVLGRRQMTIHTVGHQTLRIIGM